MTSFLISGEGGEGQGKIAGREGLTSVEINKTPWSLRRRVPWIKFVFYPKGNIVICRSAGMSCGGLCGPSRAPACGSPRVAAIFRASNKGIHFPWLWCQIKRGSHTCCPVWPEHGQQNPGRAWFQHCLPLAPRPLISLLCPWHLVDSQHSLRNESILPMPTAALSPRSLAWLLTAAACHSPSNIFVLVLPPGYFPTSCSSFKSPGAQSSACLFQPHRLALLQLLWC